MLKTNKLYFFVSYLLMIILFSFYFSSTSQGTTIPSGKNPLDSAVTASEANELILRNKDNPDFVILDVRTPEEYNDGHIEGCLNIDYKSENFKSEISKLNQDKTYLVYCRSGRRSKAAQDVMVNFGFNSVLNLAGGFEEWKKESLPFVK